MKSTLILKGLFAGVIAAGSLIISTPANAISVMDGDRLGFGGGSRFNTTSGYLDFFDEDAPGNGFGTSGGSGNVLSPSAAIFGRSGSSLSIQDIMLNFNMDTNAWELGSTVPDFLTLANGVRFRLDTFVLALDKKGTTARRDDDWLATFTGRFFDTEGGELPGIGEFDPLHDISFTDSPGGSFYSAEATAVPTPALLPGIIGMGVAAFRKRKQTGEAEESA